MRKAPLVSSVIVACALALCGPTACTVAETPAPSVSIGFGVDTLEADVGNIVRLVRAYLVKPDSSERSRALWSRVDPLDAQFGDLARGFAYQGFPATIAGVVSAAPGDSVYIVKLLHARAEGKAGVMPMAMQRLYAVRAPGSAHGWLLSNALPRVTEGWPVRTVGPVTFHYAPGQPVDSSRAARTVRFIDSVSTMFGVPAPAHIHYYVTASPDAYHRALGLDFFLLPSGQGSATGGNALTEANMVFSGDPAQGEAYLHEVAHLILRDRFGGRALLGEGIPTWLAGSKGRDTRSLLRILAEYQRSHPQVTLGAMLSGEVAGDWTNAETDALYATGALFVEAVYRRGGLPSLRALAGTTSDAQALPAAMRRHLGLASQDDVALERWWRHAATELQR